jgi:two-component system, chemotaxis family, protein-glutamate methylesterase/glutaminase
MSLTEPYRVMVVDDSTVIRGLVTRALEHDPEIKVAASVADGLMAVNTLARNDIDVVVLDIEMPVMNGLEAIPKLLAVNPNVKIVMSSTLTLNNAEISLQALELGAHDYVPKPTSTREMQGADEFKRELTEKIKTLGALARRAHDRAPRPANDARPHVSIPSPTAHAPESIVLRNAAIFRPDILAIGSSTGGPQALFQVLKHLKGLPIPIVITQHMPPTFTTILAQHITTQTGVPCAEGVDGQKMEAGKAYLAPGDFHMEVNGMGSESRISLNKNPPENFCRPSVDPMLRSLSHAYGKRLLGCILTGMGGDGAEGGKVVVANGGAMVAQDEATSVVWGMPAAAARAGICSAVLPLDKIGLWLREQALKTG